MAICILIVDVQKGFINKFTSHIPELVEYAQFKYDFVVSCKFFNKEGSFYHSLINWHLFSKGSKDTELAFNLRMDSFVVDKCIYTCVNDSFLQYLKKRNISEVHICGIDTDICVTECAVDLFENDIKPVILEKYCASTAGMNVHKQAIKTLKRFIGRDQVCFKKITL